MKFLLVLFTVFSIFAFIFYIAMGAMAVIHRMTYGVFPKMKTEYYTPILGALFYLSDVWDIED